MFCVYSENRKVIARANLLYKKLCRFRITHNGHAYRRVRCALYALCDYAGVSVMRYTPYAITPIGGSATFFITSPAPPPCSFCAYSIRYPFSCSSISPPPILFPDHFLPTITSSMFMAFHASRSFVWFSQVFFFVILFQRQFFFVFFATARLIPEIVSVSREVIFMKLFSFSR